MSLNVAVGTFLGFLVVGVFYISKGCRVSICPKTPILAFGGLE